MTKARVALALVAVAGTVAATVLVPATVASATTVPSAIGAITAEQYHGNYCDDFGADIEIGVSGGLPSTAYSATYTGVYLYAPPYYAQYTATFTTNASGNGSIVKLNTRTTNGQLTGTAEATVTAAGTSVTVSFPIACSSNQGD